MTLLLPSQSLPDIIINSDDFDRVALLAERVTRTMPYVSAYLERELNRADICQPWEAAGVSMGHQVLFRLDDEPNVRMGRLTYPRQPIPQRAAVPILGAVGAALIGMKRNSSIEWLDNGRVRTLTVLDYGW